MTTFAPWGKWEIIHWDDTSVVKVLTVNAGAMLSLQSHDQRNELWFPTETGLVAYLEVDAQIALDFMEEPLTKAVLLERGGEPVRVPARWKHRLINPTDRAISLVETITGHYDEEDITRYHDAYGRE